VAGLGEGPLVGPQRIEHLVHLAADLDRFVRGGDSAGELGLPERVERLPALEEVDAAHVAGCAVAAVDLLQETGYVTEVGPPLQQAPLELLRIESGRDPNEEDGGHGVTPVLRYP